jgi:hypothetical protein
MEMFFKELIEHDLNPFMMFDSSGRLIQYNKEAEFLLSYVSSREIYDLAVSNAPLSYGFKRSFVSLHFERNTFYAILVGYLDEEKVGIKLYKEVCDSAKYEMASALTQVNIFTILNLSKNSTLSKSNVVINELYDPSLPDVKLDVEKFLNLVNHLFREYHDAKELSIKVFLKIGETMVLDGKKYPICSVKFQSYDKILKETAPLFSKAKEAGVSLFAKDDFIMIEFPLITD